jgi:hypothetical protein
MTSERDIVEWLRLRADKFENGADFLLHADAQRMKEAAVEIERFWPSPGPAVINI